MSAIKKQRVKNISLQLLSKSREAVLNAVQTFNNPLTKFKSETFIVLMVIGWMYLLHAYYRKTGIIYRYYKTGPKRRIFDRTKSGAYKYWELERCLNENCCPLDSATKANLRFVIGLRHEIEHHQSTDFDECFSGRYLACCLNYERIITELFGSKFSLGNALTFVLQFQDITKPLKREEAVNSLPSNVMKYLQSFDMSLSDDDFNSSRYAYRMLFIPKLTSKRGQADQAIEFISANSSIAKDIDHKYWVIKETERKKYRAKDVINIIKEEGYPGFGRFEHTQLWKRLDGKNSNKGFGIEVIPGQWLWYERWLEVVRQHCKENPESYS